MQEATTYTFGDFISDIEMITKVESREADIIQRISRKIQLLISSKDDFLPPQNKVHKENHYARHLLYVDRYKKFVILNNVWGPGQGTPVHDHGTWGVMGVYSNEVKVTNYLRLDDGSKQGCAELREASGVISTVGSVTYVLPPNEEIHKVENTSTKPTITLHVYGKDIVECNWFDLKEKTYKKYRLDYPE
ncbi:cysteine dioxygenase family protein [Candidatus Peregrinibacteria bacterium]|nr:cysteine dioxygenase family protein [Candidatus Peregrinibacteria bacterium]